MSKVDRALAETFGVPPIYGDTAGESKTTTSLVTVGSNELLLDEEDSTLREMTEDEQLDEDVAQIRSSIKELIDQGKEALESVIHIAKTEEKIVAFEVANAYMSNLTAMSMQLMNVHEKRKKIKKMTAEKMAVAEPTGSNGQIVNNGGTTNIAFVGSSNDVMKFIQEKDIVINPEDIEIDEPEVK